jgi:hypothetical protein
MSDKVLIQELCKKERESFILTSAGFKRCDNEVVKHQIAPICLCKACDSKIVQEWGCRFYPVVTIEYRLYMICYFTPLYVHFTEL